MRKSLVLAVGAAALAGLALPSSAAPALPSQQVYLHCPANGKVLNAGSVTGGPTWDTTKPTASVQSGAGCGFADTGLSGTSQTSLYDAFAGGSFTGNLDKLTIQFHNINAGPSRNGGMLTVGLRLTIDGKSMFGVDATGAPATKSVPVKLVPSATGASNLAEITVTGLGFIEPELGPVQDVEHSVLFTLGGPLTDVSAWVMDTSETPSGVAFNPATNAVAAVAATTPGGPTPVEE